MDGSEQDIGASDGKGQHADHEGQDQEDGIDCVDPENDGGFSKEADSEDGWNGEADTREHRSKENIDGALQLIGQSGPDRAKRFGGHTSPATSTPPNAWGAFHRRSV